MSTGSQQPQAPVQITQPIQSPEQRELLNLALPGIRQFAAQVPQRYQGEQVAGFTAPQEAAQQELIGPAAGAQRDIAQQGRDITGFYTGGEIWNPEVNPYLGGAIDAAVRPIWEGLTEQAMPAIRGEATKTGNFGSSRQGIAEGIATRGAERAAGDTASKIAEDLYRTNVQAQLSAAGMLPAVSNLQTQGALTTGAVGDVQQAMDQARINEAMSNFTFDQYAPFLQSQEIMSLYGAMPQGGVMSTANVPQPNKLGQALGGAATGASLGATFGPWGALAGGGAGALLPFLFK